MPDDLNILFLGDIMGKPGRTALAEYFTAMTRKLSPDLIIANGENAAGGIGITEKTGQELFRMIDVLTSGNHIWDKKEAYTYLEKEPGLLRPANYPSPCPGKGSHVYEDEAGRKVGVLNLQGRVFMEPIDCPFHKADEEVAKLREITPIIIVDFHAEATSEKQAMGYYLDGRVSAVIGTHTHVPTADERILPQGTAYISDAGMVGGYNSVIGIKKELALQRFLTARPQRFEPEKENLCASTVAIKIDSATGCAVSIKRDLFLERESERQ